jgi:hypothetical protein
VKQLKALLITYGVTRLAINCTRLIQEGMNRGILPWVAVSLLATALAVAVTLLARTVTKS